MRCPASGKCRALQSTPLCIAPAGGHIQHALQSPQAWTTHTRDKQPYPSKDHFIVILGDNDKQMLQAATHAAARGYSRTAILTGGVQTILDAAIQKVGYIC